MSNKKQTAVDWLVDNLHYLHSTKWDDIVEKAKAMEKEQIKEAYSNGYEAGWDSEDWVPENYYNETFNTNEK